MKQTEKMEKAKGIIQNLLTQTKRTKGLTHHSICTAIQTTMLAVDPRTVNNWWIFLFRLELFIGTGTRIYDLNVAKAIELFEVKLPLEIDPQQKRLGAFT